jgi:ribosomal protein S18 acetylase RimI-like enzyme
MEITQVVTHDLEQLKHIAREAVIAAVPIGEKKRVMLLQSIDHDIEKFIEAPDCVYLKVGNLTPVGYVLVKEHCHLAHLFVLPEYQGLKLGQRLVSSATSACKEDNRKGFIRVNSSLNAVGFYKKMGFVKYQPEKPVPSFAVPLIFRL